MPLFYESHLRGGLTGTNPPPNGPVTPQGDPLVTVRFEFDRGLLITSGMNTTFLSPLLTNDRSNVAIEIALLSCRCFRKGGLRKLGAIGIA